MRSIHPLVSLSLILLSACVKPWDGPASSGDDSSPGGGDSSPETSTDDSGETVSGVEPRAYFIYPGATSDGGWTQSHDTARLAIEEAMGIETEAAQLVSPLDIDAAIQTALEGDYNVVITTSSDFIISTLTAASNNTDDYFLSCCGSSSTNNLTSYFGRIYQPLYVAGTVAAQMSCTGRLGVVAAKPVPQFIRHINAFTLGARSVNPNIQVEILWLNSFFNPKLEQEYANTLVDHGADVVLVQTNSTIAIEETGQRTVTCKGSDESPVYSVGYHDDGMCDAAPDRCLTSAYWNWEPYYRARLESVRDGSWDPTDVSWQPWIEGDDSVVKLLDWPLFVPGTVRTNADILAKDIRSGSAAAPFVGPVNDNKGVTKIASGTELDDVALDRICWLVEGVVEVNGDGETVPAVVPTTCVGDY